MTITPEQERALLDLYEAVKACDEALEWDPEEGPLQFGDPILPSIFMWRAMDIAYRAFGYKPNTSRPRITQEHIEDERAEIEAAAAEEAKP
jgi:hypothetical protein